MAGDDSRNDPPAAAEYRPPLTVTRPELLADGSDAAFREMIWGLLVVARRLPKFPEAFGRHIGITNAGYMVLNATAHLQGRTGVGIRQIADHLHLPGPHITTTVGKLVAAGLMVKRPNPEDARGVLATLTPAGQAVLEDLARFQSRINDVLFDNLSERDFKAWARLIEVMLDNSERALETVARLERERDGNGRYVANAAAE